ncbi:MAG: MerR family mercuric resistance operon transcriptional regulator [Chitinophagales bacterium]
MPLETYKRGQLATLTGCNGETIRYYEKIKLLPEPSRGSNGYRYYNNDHLQRLGFIMKSKSLGFDNDNIRDLLEISRGIAQHTRAEAKALTENHLEQVRQRIRDLKKIETTLSKISHQCDGANESADHCPILLSLFDQN